MSLGGPGGDATAVVAALRAVSGVADAEILPDDSGGPGTLRLQLAPGADEVLVATTVHRLLGERFGLGVDAGRVQVVEESTSRRAHAAGPPSHPTASAGRPEPAATPLQPAAQAAASMPVSSARGQRLLIHRMQLVSAQQGVTSEVTLALSGTEHTGTAGAATTPTSVHRSVALATLRAVEEALDGRVRFELEHLETTSLGSERAVVVEVSMVTRYGSERLTGVSAVRDDARQAVIRATLDALNRRIETYLAPA
jgi:hypothetical protein